jgi:hypothetical protein
MCEYKNGDFVPDYDSRYSKKSIIRGTQYFRSSGWHQVPSL